MLLVDFKHIMLVLARLPVENAGKYNGLRQVPPAPADSGILGFWDLSDSADLFFWQFSFFIAAIGGVGGFSIDVQYS